MLYLLTNDKGLEKMTGKPSFRKVVLEKCADRLLRAGRKAVATHWRELFPEFPDDTDIKQLRVIEDYIGKIHKESIGITRIRFFVEYHESLDLIYVGKRQEKSTYRCNAHLLIECEADIAKDIADFRIKMISPYRAEPKLRRILTDSLIPIIKASDYDDYATDFLKEYYPEALERPVCIDPDKLLKRMGLKACNVCITEDASIQGAMVFRYCCLPTFDLNGYPDCCLAFDPGTVIIDPRVFVTRSDGAETDKKIHEACHWFFDQKAFELARMFNPEENMIRCPIGYEEDDFDWKEYHARTLPSYILMPKESFKKKAIDCLNKLIRKRKPDHPLDIMQDAISELADYFGVSKVAVKLRLLEVGCRLAFGVFDYVDGHYVPPYGVSYETSQKKITYSISSASFFEELETNSDFNSLMSKTSYAFVENHICIKDSRYLSLENGSYKLTEYARLHIDECCIPCKPTRKVKGASFWHPELFFAGSGASYKFDPKPFIENPDDFTIIEKELDDLENEMGPVFTDMPRTFGKAVKYLMKWRKMTEEDLADGSGLDVREIRYMISGERGNKRNLVLLCIGLSLPRQIAFELCKMCPKATIDPQAPQDSRYSNLIVYGQNLPVKIVKQLLDKKDKTDRKGYTKTI